MQRLSLLLLSPLLLTALLSACTSGYDASRYDRPRAAAPLQPTRGNATAGDIHFVQGVDTVLVTGEVRGLTPNAEHGFHIHEKGDCSSGDGMSTGGHYNPFGHPHGAASDELHHVGDLPSLKADANGVARIRFTTHRLSVGSGRADDVVGHGLIVHRDPDDFRTQPTGNAGPRLACAVIARPY